MSACELKQCDLAMIVIEYKTIRKHYRLIESENKGLKS